TLVDGALANNDSFWMDLGFPVRKTPEGIKYKPLFAFLVTDLDNRVNLNVHGNVRGFDVVGNNRYYKHRSNQGWGPWEVNIGKVLNHSTVIQPNPLVTNEEWPNLFRGDVARGWTGRYG